MRGIWYFQKRGIMKDVADLLIIDDTTAFNILFLDSMEASAYP